MTVETLIAQLIQSLPNMAIAAVVLYWQKTTIDELLSHQRGLIDRLISLIEKVSILTEQVQAQNTNKQEAAQTPLPSPTAPK